MNEDKKSELGISEDRPTDWFEPLYANAGDGGSGIPWANMKTHPAFSEWLTKNELDGAGKSALVVGCGMGDDAIELETLGFQVTAFDVSDTAVQLCKERFPESGVVFAQADLLQDQPGWHREFDFVLEIYTIQALPPAYESALIQNISGFVAPGGQLLVIAEVREAERHYECGPPWLLNPDYMAKFEALGHSVEGHHVGEGSLDDEEGDLHVTAFRYCGE